MAESTPFLPTTATDNLNPDSTLASPPPANPPASKTIARLTNTSFFGSLATLVVLLAAYIICAVSPLYTWRTQTDIGGLAFFVAMTAVLSLLNRTSIRSSNTTPLTINIVLDLFLSFAIGIWAVRAIDNASQAFGYARCGRDYYGPGDEERSCIGWLIAAGCLVGAGILGGAVVGISHLTLLVLRSMNAWRSRFWSRPFPWLGSAGPVGIEFNVRILRPEGERTRAGDIEGRDQSATLEVGAETERLVEV